VGVKRAQKSRRPAPRARERAAETALGDAVYFFLPFGGILSVLNTPAWSDGHRPPAAGASPVTDEFFSFTLATSVRM